MRISTKGRYGTRALLDVALRNDGNMVPLKDIAERQEISLHYLERIVGPLVKAGFLISTRGPSGGVALNRLPEEISIREILEALEGSMVPVTCVDTPGSCNRSSFCATRDMWCKLHHVVVGLLSSVTLQDLAEQQRQKEEVKADTYCI